MTIVAWSVLGFLALLMYLFLMGLLAWEVDRTLRSIDPTASGRITDKPTQGQRVDKL